jgi:hypothetical protein
MNANTSTKSDLTPSEVIVLCGERFVDQIRSADSSSERTLHGQKTVNAERLAVAAIRGAILSNQTTGITNLTWRAADELKQELENMSKVGGLGGKMFGALSRLSVLNKPSPHLELGSVPSDAPIGTLEALFADLTGTGIGVFEQLLKVSNRPSGAEFVGKVKQILLKRNQLESFPRGFGILSPGFKLLETTRAQVEQQWPKVEAMLGAAKRNDLEMWDGLEVIITRALRSGD